LIVLGIVALSAVGLVLLLLPRFTPRAPRWAEAFVPPRYRRRAPAVLGPLDAEAFEAEGRTEPEQEHRTPVAASVSGLNGATALSTRTRLERHDAEPSR
jgi:UDP-GlcNAc:undecaprenyl-phosphate GlcNAc-1-phosphate transferase